MAMSSTFITAAKLEIYLTFSLLSCASVFSEMEKGFSHKPNKIAHQTKCYLDHVKKIWVWFMFPTSKLFIAVFLIQKMP